MFLAETSPTRPRWCGAPLKEESRIRVLLIVLCLLALATPTAASAHPHPALWAWYRHSGAKCVHGYEGSWSDPDPLYYGGFQMDIPFQRYWAPNRFRIAGTADHWTPAHQVAAVRRAVLGIGHRAAGWGPWPNTARYCGLL